MIDEFQETELIRDSDDGDGNSERTELVTDDDDGFVGEVVSGVCAKDVDLVDPDASTDEEEGFCGGDISSLQLTEGICKSTDALRTSGFTAARSMTCTPVGNKSESSNLAERNFNEFNRDKVENSHTGPNTRLMETMPCSVSELNIVGTQKDEIVLDHDTENPFRCIKSYNIDSSLVQKKETTIRSEINKEKLEPQCPLGRSEAAASYISSQEPGLQSQATALGVVDKFLSAIDVGFSQDTHDGSTDIVVSPPISNVKRAQTSVVKSKNYTAGNIQVYDWKDSLEDEGDDLFNGREYSSFDRKANKNKFRNLPSGVNKSSYGGSKSRACQKLTRIAHFGSKPKPSSKTRSKKISFNEMEEQENTERMGQLTKSDDHTIDEGVCDVGPATQLAAEAIEALSHSSPLNLEQINLQSKSGELTGISTNIIKPSRTSSRNTPTKKRSKMSQKSRGIMVRSKQLNITKSRTRCISSRKKNLELGAKMVLEESRVEMEPKMTKKKLNANRKGVISLRGSASPLVKNTVKKTVDKEVEKPLAGEKFIVGTSQIYTSPVAHRTRNSTSKLLDFNKRLSNNNFEDASGIKFCGPKTAVVPENDLASNASVVSKVNKNVFDISLNAAVDRDYGFSGVADAFEIERVHDEEIGVSHDKDANREPKRRKNNIDFKNQINDCKTDDHSKSVDVIMPKDVKLPVERKQHRVFIRSIADILDTVKRRKRTITSSNKFESDGLDSNVGKMPNASLKRRRPSLLSDILKPYLSNDSHFKPRVRPASDGTAYAYSVSSVKQVAHHDNPEKSEGPQLRLFPEVAQEYIKPEGSLDAISQPSLTCSPTIGINAVSPNCISQDISKLSAHKSLSRPSLTRELIRLESTSTSPSKLNDMRRKKDMGTFQICFSNHLSQDVIKQQKKILARLGIQVVTSASEATHFVADKFVRTRNMLEAMAMGKPVVTPMWLESCGQASCYIDERNYILRDAKKEKEIGFSMPVSLARACQHPLLQGKMLFITQNTKPNQELISSLVMTAGGQLLKKITRSMTKDAKLPEDLLIIASEEDFAVCAPLLEKGAAVFSSELLLNGIVVQKLEYERHQLFLD